MKKKFCLILIVLLFSTSLFSQNKYPSLLWEISGNGLQENSYLYGTMHVSEKIAYNLSDVFFEKLYSTKQVALESDPDLWLNDIKNDVNMYNYRANYYENYTPLYLKPTNTKSYKEALKLNDYITDGILYRRYEELQNFQENTYIDMFIYRASKKLNKKFYGLEDIEESRKIVEKANEYSSYDDYSIKKPWMKSILKGRSPREAMEDAYRNQNLDLIDSLHKGSYPEKSLKYILYIRNDNMVAAMDSLMKKGSLFSAVGAAHLAGKKGIIEKLRIKGYIVKPLSSPYTEKGKTQKENLEKLIYNHNLTLENNYDGFSIIAPKKFLTMSKTQSSYLISLDIPNGAFLSLSKFNHANFLNKNEYKTTIQSLDSLLYENIPGKIISKKYISKNGYEGIEITSKNNEDQFLNTQLFITPLEVYIFNLNGSKNYESKFKHNIFSSLKLKSSAHSFSNFNPKIGGYIVNLPDYRISSDSISSNITAYDKNSDSYYFINTQILDEISPETEEYELRRIPYEFRENLEIKDINTSINTDKVPYSESTIKLNNQKNLYLKTIINGSHYYLAGIVTDNEILKNNYFNSFKLSNFISTQKQDNFKNNLDGYSINLSLKPKETEKEWAENTESPKIDSTIVIKESDNYHFKDYYTDYNLENGQKVTISYFDSHDTDSDSLQAYERIKEFIKEQYESDSCSVQKIKFVKTGISNKNYPFYDYTLGNKNSAQTQKLRYFYENNKIYEIKYIANRHVEIINPSIEEIINNITFFLPETKVNEHDTPDFIKINHLDVDNIPKPNIIDSNEITPDELDKKENINTTTDFFEDYEYKIEGDSAIWTASNKKNQLILNQLKILSTDYKKVENFVIANNNNYLNSEILNTIITVLDYHNQTKPSFYEEIYPKFKHTGDIELKILSQLISIDKDSKSVKKALHLLKDSKPLPSSEYAVHNLLNYITSIENSENIILPKLLYFLNIEEYKEPVISYLIDLNSADKLKPKHIRQYEKYFLNEAQKIFKRILNIYSNPENELADASSYTLNEYLKNNLNILAICNNTEYNNLISEIRNTKNVELLTLISELKKPVELTEKEFIFLSKESIPSQKLNILFKEKFGKNIFNPEQNLTIEIAKKILLKNNYDYSSNLQTDSLTIKEENTLEFDSKKYKIFFFTINRNKVSLDNIEESKEEKDSTEDIYNGTEIAVIVFNLSPEKDSNSEECYNESEYNTEYYNNNSDNQPLLDIVYTSSNLSYYNEREWEELKNNLTDYLKNKEHKRATMKFNTYEYDYY